MVGWTSSLVSFLFFLVTPLWGAGPVLEVLPMMASQGLGSPSGNTAGFLPAAQHQGAGCFRRGENRAGRIFPRSRAGP